MDAAELRFIEALVPQRVQSLRLRRPAAHGADVEGLRGERSGQQPLLPVVVVEGEDDRAAPVDPAQRRLRIAARVRSCRRGRCVVGRMQRHFQPGGGRHSGELHGDRPEAEYHEPPPWQVGPPQECRRARRSLDRRPRDRHLHDGRLPVPEPPVDRLQPRQRHVDVEDELDRAAAGQADVDVARAAAIAHAPAAAAADRVHRLLRHCPLDAAARQVADPGAALGHRHLRAQRPRRGALDLGQRDDRRALAGAHALDGEVEHVVVEGIPASVRLLHGAPSARDRAAVMRPPASEWRQYRNCATPPQMK